MRSSATSMFVFGGISWPSICLPEDRAARIAAWVHEALVVELGELRVGVGFFDQRRDNARIRALARADRTQGSSPAPLDTIRFRATIRSRRVWSRTPLRTRYVRDTRSARWSSARASSSWASRASGSASFISLRSPAAAGWKLSDLREKCAAS